MIKATQGEVVESPRVYTPPVYTQRLSEMRLKVVLAPLACRSDCKTEVCQLPVQRGTKRRTTGDPYLMWQHRLGKPCSCSGEGWVVACC